MKNRKATKKFERKQLKQTIEKRRKAQKIKKGIERRQFKKKLSGNETKNGKKVEKPVDSDDELISEEIK